MTAPLDGIRVVEMATAIQGPAAGLYLSDMGADVIKVEPPAGDANRYMRGVGNQLPADALGPQFIAMNRGKRSLAVDVHTDAGGKAVHQLIRSADVFLSNFRDEALQRMGMGQATLTELQPKLIYAIVNGYGPKGPDAGKSMLDGAAQARGGLVNATGPTDGMPMPAGAAIADTAGAMQFALGIMTALVARERHGVGQRVSTSALGAQLWLQMWEIQHCAMTGADLSREGVHHSNMRGPYGVYATADGGAFLLAVHMDEDAWAAFWAFVEMPEHASDPNWDNPGKRLGFPGTDEGLPEIRAATARAFASKTTAQWEEFLAGQPEIIYERVRNYAEVLTDPQNRANDYLVDMHHPGIGRVPVVGNLVHLETTPGRTGGPAPALGEANDELLPQLGLSAEEIAALSVHNGTILAERMALLEA